MHEWPLLAGARARSWDALRLRRVAPVPSARSTSTKNPLRIAGPVAILQISIVSVATFLVIFLVARRLGLDHQLALLWARAGPVCGVSAAIAIAGAALRTWAFTFSFLSIGLITRLREFARAGGKPFLAFTRGSHSSHRRFCALGSNLWRLLGGPRKRRGPFSAP